MKKTRGITLLSLIITVIIMLILAGVTTSILGGDGIIKNSQKAVDMAKVESMRSQIQMAIINEIVKNDREITIGQIIERLEKEGLIKEGNSNSETGQVKTEPDGYVYEIKEKENGDWEVIYIGNGELTLPELLIALSKNTTGITKSVTITMIAKAESGISSYTLPKGTEQSVTSGTKEITETYTATENGTYTFTVTNGNGKTESKSITIDNILEGTIQISASPSTPTKGNVTVAITWPSDASKAIKEIQVGEGSWQVCTGEVNTVDVMVNCTIKARVRNSVEEIKTATCTINNIDKKAPKTFTASATATSNSITVSGSTEDEAATSTNGSSGIGAYYFQINGGEWVTNTDKTETSYTYTGLTQGTSYTLKMKAVDNAGNETVVNIGSKTTTSIASLGNITITPSKTTPTNQNITVSVTWPSDTTGYTKKISTNNGSTWSEYTGAVTISGNCVVKARLFDSTNQYGQTATCEINNIDKTNPTVTVKTATVTIKEGDSNSLGEYFTITANGTYGIASTVYTDTSNGNAVVTNTNTLAVGTHTIKCTVTKETGASANASVTIVVKSAAPDVTTATSIQSATTEYKDAKENKVVVPGGFKVRTDLATTVDKGIVIEDSDGNQFVWVPVGTITKSDGNTETIELGRYTFDTSNGTPTLQQSASNYAAAVTIGSYHTELAEFRESNFVYDTSGLNATAYKLKEWIESTLSNGGYYIARYEASFGSGNQISSVSDGAAGVTNQKPQFKQSTSASSSSNLATVTSTPGMLWNYLRQGDASLACRNMYVGNEYNGKDYVDCDLVNSYAWDTAIVFIEKCSDKSNYANAYDGNGTLYNTGTDTGKTTDIVCNIYDMAGNLMEWTTEYCSFTYNDSAYACAYRGGFYIFSSNYTRDRYSDYATYSYRALGFRGALYIK